MGRNVSGDVRAHTLATTVYVKKKNERLRTSARIKIFDIYTDNVHAYRVTDISFYSHYYVSVFKIEKNVLHEKCAGKNDLEDLYNFKRPFNF